ncbi:hypothetical protein D3C81_1633920 [compost metagenome]
MLGPIHGVAKHPVARQGIDLLHGAGRQGQGCAWRSARHVSSQSCIVGIGARAIAHQGLQLIRGPDREAETATTRADRGQQPPRRVGDKQQHASLRRFLKNLQQGVGCVDIQIVSRVDDRHAILGLRRALGEETGQVARLIDRDGLLLLAALDQSLHYQQIRMGLCGN